MLYTARVLIGVGEAGCLVIGPSLISDFFSSKMRGRAMAFFFLALPLGGTMAFIMVGLLIKVITWRQMFYIAGIPGFPIALLVGLLPDPPRGSSDEVPDKTPKNVGLRDYFRLLRTPTLVLIIVAQAFGTFMLIPIVHFGVEYFVSMRNMPKGDARLALGLMALIAGTIGNLLSGFIGDKLSQRMRGGYALLAAIGYLFSLPCLMLGVYAADRVTFLVALSGGCFFLFFCIPAVNAQIANVVRPAQRGAAWALAVFILHLLGDTVSPVLFERVNRISANQVVAAKTFTEKDAKDWTKEEETIFYGVARQKVFQYWILALIPASLCCFYAVRTARRDVARAKAENSEPESEPPESTKT